MNELQQRVNPLAFVFGVVKKYGDDRGGQMAALITYYGFLSLFPLLLVLFTVLGLVAGDNASITRSIEHSSLAQFPVIGTKLAANIHELHKRSVVGLVVGLLGLLWGSQGATSAGQFAMAQVWNVKGVQRPGFVPRTVRSFLCLAVLGVFLGISTFLSGVTSFAGDRLVIIRIGGLVLSLLINIGLYILAFRILTPKVVPTRPLLFGAALGGVGWTVLQELGTYLLDHTLRSTSEVYGFFAIVLGMLTWIYLGAEVTVYAAEVNVVRARRLWPRSMVQPPLTEADEQVLAAIASQEERRPEQSVAVHFEPSDHQGTAADGPEGPEGREAPEAPEAPPEAPEAPQGRDRPEKPESAEPSEPVIDVDFDRRQRAVPQRQWHLPGHGRHHQSRPEHAPD